MVGKEIYVHQGNRCQEDTDRLRQSTTKPARPNTNNLRSRRQNEFKATTTTAKFIGGVDSQTPDTLFTDDDHVQPE